MITLLLGGSPCTYWSIAQKKNRETEPSGIGWELFENYLIAKEKFKPDFFLYENNKSAAKAIKDEIKKRLDVWDGTLFMPDSGARYIEINSALVSAQNRQRFYVHNCGEVQQPEDRGILLRDILETSTQENGYELVRITDYGNGEKSRPLLADYARKGESPGSVLNDCLGIKNSGGRKQQSDYIAEPINVTKDGKSRTIKAQYSKTSVANICCYHSTYGASGVAEPVRIGDIGSTGQAHRIYSCDGKSVTINSGGGGQGGKTGLYACPIDEKNNQINRLGGLYGQATRWGIYDKDGKSPTLTASMGMGGGHIPMITTKTKETGHCEKNPTDKKQIYEVKNGFITIKDKQYPIKLADGYYIIRKLTPIECERLQTLPDNYTAAVSNSQRYKGLGNGWTAEVIIHILNGALKDVPRDEKIVVLSMYDGIGTGRYCLDKMGFTNVEYHAFEIDKYAIQIAQSNYPDIIEHGDAYQVRDGLNFIYGVQTLYRYHDRNKFHQNGDNV